jgi:CubicO group peptidase (beta-lactamase class C family)
MADNAPAYRHANEPIGTAREVYDGTLMPDLQANTFRNIDRLFATRVVKSGGSAYPLPESDRPIGDLSFVSAGQRIDLYDYTSLNRISGIVAIKDGKIVYETYQLGNDENSRWMSMSVVKSISAILVGAAIKDGYIESIDDSVSDYVPELQGTAYDGVSVRHLLQMASGAQWNETYTDPTSDRRALLEAQIAQEPGGMLDVMAALPRVADPGTRWNYSTGETQIVAALVAAATGKTLAGYLSEKIWAKYGMEADAHWWLDSPGGTEVGGSGLSATLRDYARFGLFLLNGGVAGGEQILPDGWIEAAGTPQVIGGIEVPYGYMFWPVEESEAEIHRGAYEAIGIFGQEIYVNPTENVVSCDRHVRQRGDGHHRWRHADTERHDFSVGRNRSAADRSSLSG